MPVHDTEDLGDFASCSKGLDSHEAYNQDNEVDPTVPQCSHISTMQATVGALLDCPLARSRTYNVLQSLYNAYEGAMIDGRSTEDQHAAVHDSMYDPYAVVGLIYYHFSTSMAGHLPERERFVRAAIGRCVAAYKGDIKKVPQKVYDRFVASSQAYLRSDFKTHKEGDRQVHMVCFYAELIAGLWHFGLAPISFFHSALTFLSGDHLRVLGPTDPVHVFAGVATCEKFQPYDRVDLRVSILVYIKTVSNNEEDYQEIVNRLHCFAFTVSKMVFMGLPRMSNGTMAHKELIKVWFFYFEGLYTLLSRNNSLAERATQAGLADLATRTHILVAHSMAARLIGSDHPHEYYDSACFLLTSSKVTAATHLLWDLATFCENQDDPFNIARFKGAGQEAKMRVAAANVRSGKSRGMGYPFRPEENNVVVKVINTIDHIVGAKCRRWDCIFVAEAVVAIVTTLPEDLVQPYTFRLIELFSVLQSVNQNVALWRAVCAVTKFHMSLLVEDFRALGKATGNCCQYAKGSRHWHCRRSIFREICTLVPLVGNGVSYDDSETHGPAVPDARLNHERHVFFLSAYKAFLACFCAGDMRQLLDAHDIFVLALCTLVWRETWDAESPTRVEMKFKCRQNIAPVFADIIRWLEREPTRLALKDSHFALFVAYDPDMMASHFTNPKVQSIYAPRAADFHSDPVMLHKFSSSEPHSAKHYAPPTKKEKAGVLDVDAMREGAEGDVEKRALENTAAKKAPPSGKKARSQARVAAKIQQACEVVKKAGGAQALCVSVMAEKAMKEVEEAMMEYEEAMIDEDTDVVEKLTQDLKVSNPDTPEEEIKAGMNLQIINAQHMDSMQAQAKTSGPKVSKEHRDHPMEEGRSDVYENECLKRSVWPNGRVNLYTGPKNHERRFETRWPGGFVSLYEGEPGSEYRYRTIKPPTMPLPGCITHDKPFGDDSCLKLEYSSGGRDNYYGETPEGALRVCVEVRDGKRDLYEGPHNQALRKVALEHPDGYTMRYHGAKDSEAMYRCEMADGTVHLYSGLHAKEMRYLTEKPNGCRDHYAPSTLHPLEGLRTHTEWPNGRTDWFGGPEDDRRCMFSVHKDGSRDVWKPKDGQYIRTHRDLPDGRQHVYDLDDSGKEYLAAVRYPSGKKRVYPKSGNQYEVITEMEEPWTPQWRGKVEGDALLVEADKRFGAAWNKISEAECADEIAKAKTKFAEQEKRDKPSSSSSSSHSHGHTFDAEVLERLRKEGEEQQVDKKKKLSPKAKGKQKAEDEPKPPLSPAQSELAESWKLSDSIPTDLFGNVFREQGYTEEQCEELTGLLAAASCRNEDPDDAAEDLIRTIVKYTDGDMEVALAAAGSLGSILTACAQKCKNEPVKEYLLGTREQMLAQIGTIVQNTAKEAKVLAKRAKKERRRAKHRMQQAEGFKASSDALAAAAKREAQEAQREADETEAEAERAAAEAAEAQEEAEKAAAEAVAARKRQDEARVAEARAKREAAAQARQRAVAELHTPTMLEVASEAQQDALDRNEARQAQSWAIMGDILRMEQAAPGTLNQLPAPPSSRADVAEAQQRAWDRSKRQAEAVAAATAPAATAPAATAPAATAPAATEEEEETPPETNKECVICWDSLATHVTVPCGHVCLCAKCADMTNLKHCPMCRTPLIQTMRIYV